MTDAMPDYGEPWTVHSHGCGDWLRNRDGLNLCDWFSADADIERAAACVNACRGIENPEKVVPLLVEMAKQFHHWQLLGVFGLSRMGKYQDFIEWQNQQKKSMENFLSAAIDVEDEFAALQPKREGE